MSNRKKAGKNKRPLILLGLGVLLLIVASMMMFFPQVIEGEKTQVPENVGVPYPNIARVSVADAKAAYELGSAVFVDTRGEPFFSEGHIPGALSVVENDVDSLSGRLDPSTWIITYCT